jgi:hypothetical protein
LVDALDEEWGNRPDEPVEISLAALLKREPDGFDAALVKALVTALKA